MSIWNIGIYARVSTEKEKQRESIPAQIQSLEEWIVKKNNQDKDSVYTLVKIYKDEGFSGSNFERDSFVKMKEDAEQGKINMILTRDLSRFARNYIMAGYYLEDYFKTIGIRFVSVLDNVDTLEEYNDIIPFKNILNEMYIKDCSRRTRDGLKQRMIRGSSIASKPPYGYRFLEEYEGKIKTIRLIPANDETTETVRNIYQLYIQGWSLGKIASFLNSKGIKPPSSFIKNFAKAKFGIWTSNSIKYILTNPKYAGIMAQGRWRKVSYKIKKVTNTPKEDWIYGDEFEGVISKETFEEVQKIISKRKKKLRYKNNRVHAFSGVLECKECGGSMCYRKNYKGYKCTNSQVARQKCTAHSVKEEFLMNIIKVDLKNYIAKLNIDDFYEELIKIKNRKFDHKKLEGIESRLQVLAKKMENLYDDKINNILSEKNFYFILEEVQKEQELLQAEKIRVEKGIEEEFREDYYNEIKSKINNLLSFENLNRNMVELLIEKIIISENKESGDKSIEIIYKFDA